ncbi:MAG: NAD/FAD-dependent oxidoreductase-like [Frankiales bacterium]|nr:NAD/FAD-dependent oxidoreductase-like [Frankiales bacterium]
MVGAGIAGIACARELLAAGHEVTVFDRGHVPGGRLASRTLAGRRVDLGASYLTARDDRFQAVVDDWLDRGLARPWTRSFHSWTSDTSGPQPGRPGPLRFGAAHGLRTLVEDLARDVPVRTGTQVTRVGPGPVVDGTAYDTVVLAMPDPQALALLEPGLVEVRALLADRAWEPALALAAGFAARSWDLDGVFVNDHPVLSWIADDGARRGDGAAVLVAHATPAFAAPRLAEPATAVPELVTALREVLDLPEPGWTRVQRWTYAKPVGERAAPYGLVGPEDAPTFGLCGDGWGASKVEAAWLSGHLLGRCLAVSSV